MKISTSNIKYLIGIILISFSLSPLCVWIMTQFNTYNISEVFMVPGFFLILSSKKELKALFKGNLKKRRFIYVLIILLILFGIGIVNGKNPAYAYGDFRSILVFTFFFMMRIKNSSSQSIMRDFIYYVFLGLTLFDVLYLIMPNYIVVPKGVRNIVMNICPFFLSIIFLNKKQYHYSLIMFFILTFETVVSSMRINYLLILFYFFYMLIHFNKTIFSNKQPTIKFIFYLTIVLVLSYNAVAPIFRYLESDVSRYIHSVKRTEALINDFEATENTRINTIMAVINEPLKLLIPQGLGWRNHFVRVQSLFRYDYAILSTMDSNIFYCFYHFGLVLGLLSIIYILQVCIRLFINLWRVSNIIGFTFYGILVSSVLVMFTLKTWIFAYLNFGIIYSFVIVLARYPDPVIFSRIKNK